MLADEDEVRCSYMEKFHHFGTVFAKKDREREKWCRSRVRLCDKVGACKLTVFKTDVTRAILSRDFVLQSRSMRLCCCTLRLKLRTRATKSRDRIAGVASV